MAHSFYAVLSVAHDTRELRHVKVEGPVQTDLGQLFEQLQTEFHQAGTAVVPFNPLYTLEDDEIFELKPYRTPDFLAPISEPAQTTSALSSQDLEDASLRSIVRVNKSSRALIDVLFLYVDNRHVLRRSAFNLLMERGTFRRMDDTGISVPGNLVAELSDSRLLFKNFNTLGRILDLSEYAQEATGPQMVEFFQHRKFLTEDVAALTAVADSAIRKRISSVLASRVLDKCSVAKIVEVGEKYGVEVSYLGSGSKARIIVKPERAYMKQLLRLLAEDYLDSALSPSQFLVNSKRRLGASDGG